MYDLGLRIKELRKQRGITQSVLAKRISKSVSAVSSYESNSQMPPLDVLLSIADSLNVTLDQLVGFDTTSSVSLRNLSPKQREVVNLILAEFSFPSSNSIEISLHQLEILQKLILLFSGQQ